MSCAEEIGVASGELPEACEGSRASFSAYLDGALDGHSMAQLAAHLRSARTVMRSSVRGWLDAERPGRTGPAQVPTELQARLRDALASEIVTGSAPFPGAALSAVCGSVPWLRPGCGWAPGWRRPC